MIYSPHDGFVDWTNFFKPGLDLSENSNSLIPLQFTGLKDRNGKEIWEGDIVLHQNKPYEVRHFERGTSFRLESPTFVVPFTMAPKSTREVVGNIYENPDLLKQ